MSQNLGIELAVHQNLAAITHTATADPYLFEASPMKFVKLFASDESGATAIEYALIASLIAIALVTILGSLGTRLSGEFSEISSALK